jgi:hypothetical protein
MSCCVFFGHQMSVRRRLESTNSTDTNNNAPETVLLRKGLTRVSRDIYGHIQSYLYIDDLASLLLTNKSINALIINHITFHPFDIYCDSPTQKSNGISYDHLTISCLQALTTISRYCRGTVRRLIFPWRSFRGRHFPQTCWGLRSERQYSTESQFSMMQPNYSAEKEMLNVNRLCTTIIQNNRQSLLEIINFGSHLDSVQRTTMSTCERLMKWKARTDSVRTSHDMKLLYQSCRHLSELSLSDVPYDSSTTPDDTWLKG